MTTTLEGVGIDDYVRRVDIPRRRGLAAAAFGVQCLALYAPRAPGPPGGLPLDKVAHLALFAVVTALAIWAGLPRRWVIVAMVGQAVLSEAIQEVLLVDRSGDLADLTADLVGIALGIAIGGRRSRSGPSPTPDELRDVW